MAAMRQACVPPDIFSICAIFGHWFRIGINQVRIASFLTFAIFLQLPPSPLDVRIVQGRPCPPSLCHDNTSLCAPLPPHLTRILFLRQQEQKRGSEPCPNRSPHRNRPRSRKKRARKTRQSSSRTGPASDRLVWPCQSESTTCPRP